MTRVRFMLAGIAAVLVAGTAVAATPESGTVSSASPKVEWTGTVLNSYVNRIPVLLTEDDSVPCLPEFCDSFALEVADSANLTISGSGPESSTGEPASVTLRVFTPDDQVIVSTGDAPPDKPWKLQIKNAKTGAYTVEYFNNFVGPADYVGSAELAVPTAEPAPAPGPGGEQPPAESFTVDVKAGKASARKLNRSKRFSVKVTVSREVQSAVAIMKKGAKTVARGRLGAFSGTKTLKLKLSKKLKRGTYTLGVEATDSAGTRVGRTLRVRVGR